jgi:hypothetical protein
MRQLAKSVRHAAVQYSGRGRDFRAAMTAPHILDEKAPRKVTLRGKRPSAAIRGGGRCHPLSALGTGPDPPCR